MDLDKMTAQARKLAQDDVTRAAGGCVDMNPYSTVGVRNLWRKGYDLEEFDAHGRDGAVGSANWRCYQRGRQARLIVQGKLGS